jgi:glutamate carboxypeptidase
MKRIKAFCEAAAGWAQRVLVELATLESPTDDKAAVDRCGTALRQLAASLGATVDVLPERSAGDNLRARFGAGPARVLVLTHFDTVWPVGQLRTMPIVERDGRLYGPGVYDMKGGIVIGLLAMRALFESVAVPAPAQVVFLMTSDEETGSATSRALIEEEAAQSDAVLVLEPGIPGGAVKTGRKGVGEFRLTVEGVAAHAGADPSRGASAVDELARQILAVRALQRPAVGLSVNVGVVSGGTRSNVVAERATADIDVRITRQEDAPLIERALRDLRAIDTRTTVSVTGRINRPPFERTPGVVRLYELARGVAAELGWALDEGYTGGASDGNFTGALGVPTLDGLGALGDHAHALQEHVLLESLPQRAALLAGLVSRIAGGIARP